MEKEKILRELERKLLHTSRYNVQTKRLTKAGFTAIFQRIEQLLA